MYSAFKTDDLLGTRYRATRRSVVCAVALMCATLSPKLAAVNPPPDGGYGNGNTAEGTDALLSFTSGSQNTAIGEDALFRSTQIGGDTAVGCSALRNNTTGDLNTAVGGLALINNTTGSENTAMGYNALGANTTGEDNTAIGIEALSSSKVGNDNTATGFQALQNNISSDNTADGFDALASNTSGADNTASGFQALFSNLSGAENTAAGFQALVNNKGNNNTAMGSGALANTTTGGSNVALGFDAGVNLTKGSNNIDIGANVVGVAGEASTIRIGKSGTQQKTFVAGIFGKTAAGGVGVVINSSGQLGTVQSSARFKKAIRPMDKASEALLKLKPVTFQYKEELDPEGIPQFGLVAEEVEKIDPDLVVRDEKGTVTTVRYEAVNAMLLNEFLKEHRKTEALEATVAKQQQEIEALAAKLEE